jgi:hypothetical protein
MMTCTDQARNDAICARRDAGESIASLARTFHISITRVQQIVDAPKHLHRQQLQMLGLNVRAWNVLANSGIVQGDELDTITREGLIARLAAVDLVTIGKTHNCGQQTLDMVARLLERPRVKMPKKLPRPYAAPAPPVLVMPRRDTRH